MNTEKSDAIILKILARRRGYQALNQAQPKLSDDPVMDKLLDELIDVVSAEQKCAKQSRGVTRASTRKPGKSHLAKSSPGMP